MTETEKQEVRWAPFLAFIDTKKYATGYLDMSLAHEDYRKGIHISIPTVLELITDSVFEYNGKKMKALTVHKCPHWDDSVYVFAREIQ